MRVADQAERADGRKHGEQAQDGAHLLVVPQRINQCGDQVAKSWSEVH